MADLVKAVQGAIHARLAAAGLGVPVFSVLPDKQLPPAVVIGESAIDEIGSKTASLERHTVTITTLVPGTSKGPLFAAMAGIKTALHHQPLTFAGAVLSTCEYLSGGELRDFDEAVLVGRQSFLVFAQDA